MRGAGFTNVHEYEFRSVVRAVAAQTEPRCQGDPGRAEEIRAEGIGALMELWRAAGRQSAPGRDESLHVLVPTRAGRWEPATALYLGTPYPKGVLMDALLGSLRPEMLVAGPDAFGAGCNAEEWQDFLLWLGVENFPRKATVKCESRQDRGYLEHVRRAAGYPINYYEFSVESSEDHKLCSARVATIEHLDEILEQADPHAVLAWIAKDDRIRSWRSQGDTEATLQARFRERTYRDSSRPVSVPSYVLWAIQRRDWLPTAGGARRPPADCVLGRIAARELQQAFPRPSYDPRAEVFGKLHLDQQAVTEALIQAGAHMNLEDFTWEQLYALMLRLPELDPEGSGATRLYRVVAKKAEDEEQGALPGSTEEKFKRIGRIWACVKGNWSYVPVASGVYFRGDATISKAVADHYPMADLPRRGGIEKIARLFGVKPLRSKDIEIAIDRHDRLPGAEEMNDELRRLKPYVLAVRPDSTPTVAGLAQFKKLTVIPCSQVKGRAIAEGVVVDISLGDGGESVLAGTKAYLVVPVGMRGPFLDDVLVARQIANVLAEVLDVERASDFAQLALARGRDQRTHVLSDILGHDAGASLSQAKQALQVETDDELEPAPREPIATEQVKQPQTPTKETQVPPQDDALKSEPTHRPVPDDVEVTKKVQGPAGPRKKVTKRVLRAKPLAREQVDRRRRVTDGERCEGLAERFEESQGRFPLRVSAIQGVQGFGCDIVSFATSEERQQFVESQGRSIRCVRRFIEVKGRSQEKGSVPLEGNELKAARQHREKYYIYRVYEAVHDHCWEIVELADPLEHEWPVTYQVDPFRCRETRYWTVAAAEPDDRGAEPDTLAGNGGPGKPNASLREAGQFPPADSARRRLADRP